MNQELLSSKPPKAISKVRQYINDKYDLLLTLKQVTALFNEPSELWVQLDYVNKLERSTISVKMDGYIHNMLWIRLTGDFAPNRYRFDIGRELHDLTDNLGWEDNLYSYSNFILKKFRDSIVSI